MEKGKEKSKDEKQQ
jgi:hypothetical protein